MVEGNGLTHCTAGSGKVGTARSLGGSGHVYFGNCRENFRYIGTTNYFRRFRDPR